MALNSAIKHQNNLFWEALVISLFIFGCGLILGIYIENGRASSIEKAYSNAEISLLDIQTQTALFDTGIDCNIAIRKNIEFGDTIYQEALKMEQYEASKQLTDSLIVQQKKFSTLRVLFFVNSMKIREKCGEKFDIVTYFYQYDPKTIEQKTIQTVFSNRLFELKQKYGNDVILIPIATNLNISSAEILKENYLISNSAILINNNTVLRSIDDVSKIENYLSSNTGN